MAEMVIEAASGYLPLLRFDRKIARTELKWSGLGGGAGLRAVAGWDEDALTMAVEAARGALPDAAPARVTFASTSAPFTDRSQAGLLIEALHLDPRVHALDVAGTRRCAVSALARALTAGTPGRELIAAGEKRRTAVGSSAHLAWGDGGAAVLTGPGPGLARLRGAAAANADLLDSHTSAERGTPYAAEERFARDAAVEGVLVPVIRDALAAAGVEGGRIALAVVPEPVAGTYRALARPCGLAAPNLCEEIAAQAGELGTAMPLFGLTLALERAAPGDLILLVGFGNGADALVLEATGTPGAATAGPALAERAPLTSMTRFLSLTGGLALDWGPRSEVNQKTAASTLMRHGRDIHGFVGGRDPRGNVQFPKTPIPVSPAASGPEPYEDVVLRDVPARVASITADRLNFTPDPPFHFGLVQFGDGGARVAMEFCDVEGPAPQVGDPVQMRFRIKAIDRQRQFRTYFWKAAPLSRPAAKES